MPTPGMRRAKPWVSRSSGKGAGCVRSCTIICHEPDETGIPDFYLFADADPPFSAARKISQPVTASMRRRPRSRSFTISGEEVIPMSDLQTGVAMATAWLIVCFGAVAAAMHFAWHVI